MAGVILDAGHGGYDNGAQYDGRKEKDDNLRLTLAVGQILEQNGVPVSYTRQSDIYQSPSEKARLGNESGADYFISFHRNASPNANEYQGVETLVFDDQGIKAEMARNVNANLEQVGFRNIGVKERPNLTVLRRTKIPAILIEAGFLNSDQDNERFDEKFQEIAQAIADGYEGNIVYKDPYYAVQIGEYNTLDEAVRLENELKKKGYDTLVIKE